MKRIYLKKEINPDYYEIGEEHGKLMERWNEINNNTHRLKIPKLFLFKAKNKLIKIREEGQELQKDYIAWNKKASNFMLNPKYGFEQNQEGKELAYLQFTDIIRFLVNSMHENMVMLTNNYNNRHSAYREQGNFVIAIIAFCTGLLGLIISIYSTFF